MEALPKINNVNNLKRYLDAAQKSALSQSGGLSALNAGSLGAVSPVVGNLGSVASILGSVSQVGNLVSDVSSGSTDHGFTPEEEAAADKKTGQTVGSVVGTIASIIGTILMFL